MARATGTQVGIGANSRDEALYPILDKDADGGLTIYIQNESPGDGRKANWLPAPKGPFMMALRYYWPKPKLLTTSGSRQAWSR